ncbi:hypothetical protein KQI65_04410 [bacterium]|nr:hypothetical protein [bacterium]
MIKFLPYLAAAVVLLISSGCCPCDRTSSAENAHADSAAPTIPLSHPPTEIALSSGGGFSGYVSGEAITPDGFVISWHGRPGTRENLDTLAHMDGKQHAQLLDDVYAQDPAGIRLQETGNMTTALIITSGDEVWTITWSGQRSNEEAVPFAARKLRDIVWNALQSITPANPGTE